MTVIGQPALVVGMDYEAEGTVSVRLRRMDSEPFPPVDPGAHIELFLPNGLSRSYSLSNMPEESGTYRITVACDANSRGGSMYIHNVLRVGDSLEVSEQRNNFHLDHTADFSLFIAGGIGVTPFVPMIARLNQLGKSWRLYYCVRTRHRAALLKNLESLVTESNGEIILNFDEEQGGKILDLTALMSSIPPNTHMYCCGPTGMLDAYRAAAAAAGFSENMVHFEYFASSGDKATDGGFSVICQRSGVTVRVKSGETILAALAKAGVFVPASCQEGICGSCETKVIAGEPDHRDMILSSKERDEGKKIMICCSGSRSDQLILDC